MTSARSTSARACGIVLALLAVCARAPAAAAQDSDFDGISDEVELNGVPGEPLLDFPAFGADPDVPDLFVQADWVPCDPILEYCGPNNSLDRNQLSSRAAEWLAAFFAPEVRVHVDNGVPPPRPELATLHGAWGGARRLRSGSGSCNSESLGKRHGYFHRGTFADLNSGGRGTLYGFCFSSDSVNMGVAAQELGHNFGIDHGGNRESYPANCKPHYRSPMNYAFTYDRDVTQFSRGVFEGMVLNPSAMDEQRGLGTSDPAVLEYLSASPWDYYVREDGAIDWNRDGRFDTQPVRAAPNWAWSSCEQSSSHTDHFLYAAEPTLAWLPDPGQPRLYLFARGNDGVPEYRMTTRFDRCDMFQEPTSCTNWTPGLALAGSKLANGLAGQGAVAAAGWEQDDGAHLMLVYASTSGDLHEQRLAIVGGQERWQPPVRILGAHADDSPALILVPGPGPGPEEDRLLLLVPEAGFLYRWEYVFAEARWSGPFEETWDDGTPILPCSGPALTRGFDRGPDVDGDGVGDSSGEQLYIALAAGDDCTLELARRVDEGVWMRLTEQAWEGAPPLAGGRPGLAYVPFDPAIPGDGRFYLAWRPYPSGAGLVSMTEGNDLDPDAPDRRLQFWRGTYLRNVWGLVSDGMTLEFDARFDDNLRAVWNYAKGGLQFHPFADGIIDVDMRDQDDYTFILDNLACSLRASCSP